MGGTAPDADCSGVGQLSCWLQQPHWLKQCPAPRVDIGVVGGGRHWCLEPTRWAGTIWVTALMKLKLSVPVHGDMMGEGVATPTATSAGWLQHRNLV